MSFLAHSKIVLLLDEFQIHIFQLVLQFEFRTEHSVVFLPLHVYLFVSFMIVLDVVVHVNEHLFDSVAFGEQESLFSESGLILFFEIEQR